MKSMKSDIFILFLIMKTHSFQSCGTLAFEEGGISDNKTEFGREYLQYRKEVNAFVPNLNSIVSV